MPIQFEFFLIPVTSATETAQDLNRFLRSANVICVEKELITTGASKNALFA